VTAIRHLAASHTGDLLAAAEFERVVHLWNLRTGERLRTIDTTLDFGGHRLAVAEDGKTIAVGAYHVHGIAAYSAENGSELWRRKDLKKVQQITFTGDGSRLLCCFERGSCESLNALNGRSGKPLRGVRGAWESPIGPIRFLERSRDYVLANSDGQLATISRASFAVLSVAFSDSQFCITEAGGPVRCFAIPSAEEVWRHVPPNGTHFLYVAFSSESRRFVGVSWPYERGGQLLLHVFDRHSGLPDAVVDVGAASELTFCWAASRLVSSSGSIFEIPSGRIAGTLAFPPRSRP
jgi:WD40 repeat protein